MLSTARRRASSQQEGSNAIQHRPSLTVKARHRVWLAKQQRARSEQGCTVLIVVLGTPERETVQPINK
jgi:hypothetical protein